MTKTIELESQVGQLQTSLLDIAQIVIDDADKQDQEDLDQGVGMTSTSVFVKPSSRNFRTMRWEKLLSKTFQKYQFKK